MSREFCAACEPAAPPRKRAINCGQEDTLAMRQAALLVVLCLGSGYAQSNPPQLLQKPTLSKTQIAFVYAGDLWTAPREGGEARHLTTGPGIESNPVFSPDGSTIAFTGEYDGNVDIYIVPA